MDFEVLFTGDEGIYIVKKDGFYYTINVLEDMEPFKSRYVEAFLKFGGFDYVDYEISEDIKQKIESVLKKHKGFLI